MNRAEIQRRAQALIAAGAVVLDTETTGLETWDEVIELAAIDMTGRVIFESLIRPRTAKIHPRAFGVHKISVERLKDSPQLPELWPLIERELAERLVVAYNAPFDRRMIQQSCRVWADALPKGPQAFDALNLKWSCLMQGYQQWVGGTRTKLISACVRHGIEPGRHSAASDARAALGLLQFLAGAREMARAA